jgi:hypothetical protein
MQVLNHGRLIDFNSFELFFNQLLIVYNLLLIDLKDKSLLLLHYLLRMLVGAVLSSLGALEFALVLINEDADVSLTVNQLDRVGELARLLQYLGTQSKQVLDKSLHVTL